MCLCVGRESATPMRPPRGQHALLMVFCIFIKTMVHLLFNSGKGQTKPSLTHLDQPIHVHFDAIPIPIYFSMQLHGII